VVSLGKRLGATADATTPVVANEAMG